MNSLKDQIVREFGVFFTLNEIEMFLRFKDEDVFKHKRFSISQGQLLVGYNTNLSEEGVNHVIKAVNNYPKQMIQK